MNANAIGPATQTAVTPSTTDANAIWLAMIERAAKDPAIDLMKLERMLALRAQEEARQAAWRYRDAMALCQGELAPVRADSLNPQTRSKYASLAAVDNALRPVYTA